MLEIRTTEIRSLDISRKSKEVFIVLAHTGMTRYLNKIYLDNQKKRTAESVNSASWLKRNKFASKVLRHLLCVL